MIHTQATDGENGATIVASMRQNPAKARETKAGFEEFSLLSAKNIHIVVIARVI